MTTYLVTGSNRGIGLEYCRQLKDRGHEVIATCRTSSPELDALAVRVETGVDVTSGSSVLRLKEKLIGIQIDVLIQNAGIAEFNSLSNLDPESVIRQFQVNALSPLCFTHAFLSHMGKGGKVALMTSRMGSIDDNTSGGSYGYRMSKVALCMAGKSLSIDLQPYGIAVAILHPGLVSTRMTGFTSKGIQVEYSVNGLLERIDSLTINNSGTFWHANGEILPW
ncbi:SDR family oxidoreductase [Prochlorococcus sp. MIT 1307]|uniref:SDR family oxidoreductase n=1 Tax=Prochlorococcus sp. MIT 1307 TaxID=3096219 RepID=UPI002A7616DC|nr:SDR family oxidoreductase [Prochlorococcus sp. MIT 1307]